ncbi:hypothetical protein ASG01_05165 [Chryseobacterium sp. Leaf180]|uniref:hypothetical protein n=1 Tax=Chryseobacterium sp. Leaf180 TaxID=1736289 RepID=UPI0006FF0C79|nr:hypothetical protein [Chryseobacterium sp. Leaf180]KQR95240.1 hypothetical protein ASG01_05165 [Chryseobacterium sp. Leaf180]
MKKKLLFLFSGLYFLPAAQSLYADSTKNIRNWEEEVDCNTQRTNSKKLYQLFKKEEKKIDYKPLSAIIINDLDTNNLTDRNIIFKLYTTETVYAAFTICAYNINTKNPNYNYLNFYTPENIKLLQKKVKKNLYFDLSDSKFENNEYRPLKEETIKHPFYNYLSNLKSADKSICYDPETTVSEPGTLNGAGGIQLGFRNHLGGIVVVKYDYFIYKRFSPTIFKTYLFKDKNWTEIPTKEEYLF